MEYVAFIVASGGGADVQKCERDKDSVFLPEVLNNRPCNEFDVLYCMVIRWQYPGVLLYKLKTLSCLTKCDFWYEQSGFVII